MRVARWMRTSSSLAMDPDRLGRALGRDEELFNVDGGLPQTGGAGALGAGRRAAGPPLEVPLDGLELSRQVADVELRVHAGEELDPVDGLGQELADALVHALEARVHVVAGREQDDGEALTRLAQRLAHREAVHAGHHHVEEHDVDRLDERDAQALLAGGRAPGLVARALEQAGRDFAAVGVVVDDQDGRRLGRGRHSETSGPSSASSASPPRWAIASSAISAGRPGRLRLCFSRKWWTRRGMSERRSRSGGMTMGMTWSR